MKKLLSILLVAVLSFGAVSCNNVGPAKTVSAAQNAIAQKIKTICGKEIVQKALEGKKINEVLKEEIEKMSTSEREDALKVMPGVSLDLNNFATEDSTYAWIAEAAMASIKYSIDEGNFTQEQMDQTKALFSLMGITMPDIKVEKNLSEEDLSKLCESLLDVVDRITNPETLKLFGIDVDNPESLAEFTKQISGSFGK